VLKEVGDCFVEGRTVVVQDTDPLLRNKAIHDGRRGESVSEGHHTCHSPR
jgi:hypothetical protein